MLFRLGDFSKSGNITSMDVHVKYDYIFVGDTTGSIRRIHDLQAIKSSKIVVRGRMDRLQTIIRGISVDWLNDQLYFIEEMDDDGAKSYKIKRCNLNGDLQQDLISTSLNNYYENSYSNKDKSYEPIDLLVDPYNGYLYYTIKGKGLYRLDLIIFNDNHGQDLKLIQFQDAQHILKEPSITVFTVDYSNYRIYYPSISDHEIYKKKAQQDSLQYNSIKSITLNGEDSFDIRNEETVARIPTFNDVSSLIYFNGTFYWTAGDEIFKEDYHEDYKKFIYNRLPVDGGLFTGAAMLHALSQPYPKPLNPALNVQAVFTDTIARVFWTKPELIGGVGHGSWQKWSYELSIFEDSSNATVFKNNINITDCIVEQLIPNTKYIFKVRAYSSSGKGVWSSPFTGKTHKSNFQRRTSSNNKKNPIITPFALWSTRGGLIKSNLVGEQNQILYNPFNFDRSLVNGECF